ncbi:MAG TPA: hypothetical protein VIY48_05570 [Candidatus Paceibacterota bacterium]
MAEVSGPGQFSKRTDKAVGEANRNLPDAGYGEQAQYQAAQEGMQKPQQVDVSGMNFADLFGDAASRVIPLGAPTGQPDVPVTSGAASGAGPGEEALNLSDQRSEDLQRLNDSMTVLEFMANQPGASWAMRNYVRQLKGQL